MAVRSLRFVLTGEDKSASKALDKVGRKADGLGSKLGKLSAFSGAALGAGAVVFAKSSIQAYAEAEKAQSALAFSFKKFPKLADASLKSVQDLNTALAKKTVYDDDAIASGQTVLAGFKLTGTQLKKITPLLLDYASKTGKDLPTAATDLGRALQGNTKSLKAVGIKYKATGDQAKDFDGITGALAKQLGGFATNEGKTTEGQLKILKNRFGELKESVGEQLLPVVSTFVKWLNDKGVPALQHFADEFKDGKGAGGELRDALVEIKDAAQTAGDVANKTIVPVIKWFADHPNALKGLVAGMLAYKTYVTVAAAQTKSLAIWSGLTGGGGGILPVPGGGKPGVPGGLGGIPMLPGAFPDVRDTAPSGLSGRQKQLFSEAINLTTKSRADLSKAGRDDLLAVFRTLSPTSKDRAIISARNFLANLLATGGPAANPTLSPTRTPEGPVRHRRRGGNVEAGLRYMVGEDGPEWITPRYSGTVHPSSRRGAHSLDVNPYARLDTSQIIDNRAHFGHLFTTASAPRQRSPYAPAGMRDYISYHTTTVLDGKKIGTATTRRMNARTSRGHLPPGVQ